MRQVPSRLVDEKHSVRTWRNGLSNLRQMQVHRLGVAAWQDRALLLCPAGQMAPKM